MKTKAFFAVATVAASVLLWTACSARIGPGGTTSEGDDIAGVVTGVSGPEAGVWVIAETKLSTPYRKVVVTDDLGRFLVPDLPAASSQLK